eukprot:CAMPEP_0117693422 /NCGR_PEP_ID=MMETSP0804-20121206/26870_1 /TAXON_ID=1074897 /ORGANISM="Tetraselmis astigmatica, Strain CCMP880" /LENGTH=179 /DNA_ID=CAMNT_0005506971 /DNA_START=183 /DNA_END=722 /DNA_ORIENTATION=-
MGRVSFLTFLLTSENLVKMGLLPLAQECRSHADAILYERVSIQAWLPDPLLHSAGGKLGVEIPGCPGSGDERRLRRPPVGSKGGEARGDDFAHRPGRGPPTDLGAAPEYPVASQVFSVGLPTRELLFVGFRCASRPGVALEPGLLIADIERTIGTRDLRWRRNHCVFLQKPAEDLQSRL